MFNVNDLEDEFDAILAETHRRYFSDLHLEDAAQEMTDADAKASKASAEGTGQQKEDTAEQIPAEPEEETESENAQGKDTDLPEMIHSENLTELRELYEKNNILVERLREMNMETTSQMRDTMREITQLLGNREEEGSSGSDENLTDAVLGSIRESQEKIAALLQQSDDFNHKESVRVYKNIQASTAQELEKRNAELTAQIEELKGIIEARKNNNLIQIMILGAAVILLILEILNISGVFNMLM